MVLEVAAMKRIHPDTARLDKLQRMARKWAKAQCNPEAHQWFPLLFDSKSEYKMLTSTVRQALDAMKEPK